jgi:hypothetical protein
MSEQSHPFLRNVTNVVLLGGFAASFAYACVSSNSDNNGATGGAGTIVTGGGGNTDVGGAGNTGGGGNTPQGGGANGTGGGSSAPCTFTTGLTSGPTCTVSPAIFVLDATSCSFGNWDMSSGVLSGGLACWSGIAQDCTGGNYHITGSYNGQGVPNAGGNAGFNTFYNVASDAGPGCSIVDASNYSGLTLDVNNVTIPDNTLIVGINNADGNKAETTLTLTAGQQTVHISWAQLKKSSNCGPPTGSNIATIYYVFKWFSDSNAHAVDATFSNIGFYN